MGPRVTVVVVTVHSLKGHCTKTRTGAWGSGLAPKLQ